MLQEQSSKRQKIESVDADQTNLVLKLVIENEDLHTALSLMLLNKYWKEFVCTNILSIAEDTCEFSYAYRYYGLYKFGCISEEAYETLKVRLRKKNDAEFPEGDFDFNFRMHLLTEVQFMPTKLAEHLLGKDREGFLFVSLLRNRVPGRWIEYHLRSHDYDDDLWYDGEPPPVLPTVYLLEVAEALKEQHEILALGLLVDLVNKKNVELLCNVATVTGTIEWLYLWNRGNCLDKEDIEMLLKVAENFKEPKPRLFRGRYCFYADWITLLFGQIDLEAFTFLWDIEELKDIIKISREKKMDFVGGESKLCGILSRFAKVYTITRKVDIRATLVKQLSGMVGPRKLIGILYEGEKASELRPYLDSLGPWLKLRGKRWEVWYARTWEATCGPQ